MAYGTRYIQPGYRRSVGEALWDQRVKMSAAISGRWLPSSREIRGAKLGAMESGMREAAKQHEKTAGAMTRRRMQQAMYRPGVPQIEQAPEWRGATDSGKDLLTTYLLKLANQQEDEEED